jgi:hypothetical protein
MPNLPPTQMPPYTDAERALIASYLLQKRVGLLQALRSVEHAPPQSTDGWGEGNQRYYRDAEAYSRFLLWWIGYPVNKNQMYTGG